MAEYIMFLTPVLLHLAVTVLTARLWMLFSGAAGIAYDPTLATVLGNLLVLPPAVWMYRRDCAAHGEPGSHTRWSRAVGGKSGSHARWPRAADRESGREMPRLRHSRAEQSSAGGQGMNSGWQTGTRAARKGFPALPDDARAKLVFGVLCVLAGGLLNIAWSGILNAAGIQEVFSNQVQERMLSSDMALQIIGLGMIAPAAEEMIFRGLTYRRMRRRFPTAAAAVLSAALFALYHGNPIQILFAFPLAVVLALIFEYGGSPVFPILFHMGSNLTAVLLNFCI